MKKTAAILLLIAASTLAFAAEKLMDDKLAANTEVVVRAKLLSFEGADKYAMFRVRVLEVLKSPPGAKLANELSVAAYSVKPGVPAGVSTLYLEPYNKQTNTGLWKLVGGEASTGVSHNTPEEPDRELTQQISDILMECKKLGPGTTRAELLKVFTTEGGISNAKQRTYVHRSCPYIKVDVEFTLSDPKQSVLEERPTDIVSRISKPYLYWSIND